MPTRLSRWLIYFGMVVAGTIFGPVLVAALTAAIAPEQERASSAYDLLIEFDGRNRSTPLSSIDVDGAASECGYNPETLFSERDMDAFPSRQSWKWSPYAGFFALWLSRSSAWHNRLRDLRAEQLVGATSGFGARFLRACMRQTLFAPLCEQRTHTLLGKWSSAYSGPADAGDALATPGETGMICTYLDGVAARKGMPLAKR